MTEDNPENFDNGTTQVWARKCKVKDCIRIALAHSDYCAIHSRTQERGSST